MTWTPSTIWSARHYRSGATFRLDLAAAICEPLGGFLNFLIFLSNRPSLRKQLVALLTCQKYDSDEESKDEQGTQEQAQEMARVPGESATHRVSR